MFVYLRREERRCWEGGGQEGEKGRKGQEEEFECGRWSTDGLETLDMSLQLRTLSRARIQHVRTLSFGLGIASKAHKISTWGFAQRRLCR